jgi:3-isopropylmalate/(R)-2-methylmalate dehydratase small subunit
MPSTPFVSFSSKYVVLSSENIDTDQIIPARFLTTTERHGLGAFAFHDRRYDAHGNPRCDFALNAPTASGAAVLVAGRNFGCGSSREHAVWALMDAGFRAVVSESFADIFRANALGNGLLPIAVDKDVVRSLVDTVDAGTPGSGAPRVVHVNINEQTLTLPEGRAIAFAVPPFAKHCLIHGIDEMDFVLGASDEVAMYERRNPARVTTIGQGAVSA